MAYLFAPWARAWRGVIGAQRRRRRCESNAQAPIQGAGLRV